MAMTRASTAMPMNGVQIPGSAVCVCPLRAAAVARAVRVDCGAVEVSSAVSARVTLRPGLPMCWRGELRNSKLLCDAGRAGVPVRVGRR